MAHQGPQCPSLLPGSVAAVIISTDNVLEQTGVFEGRKNEFQILYFVKDRDQHCNTGQFLN